MKIKLLIYLFALLIIFNFSICGAKYESYEIKIGFVGGFSAGVSDLGVSGRRGVVLAVEEMNLAGGLNGYKIQLVIKDDENMPYKGLNSINEFMEKEVVASIGFFTNQAISQSVETIQKNNLLLISPLLSSDQLSKSDSSIIRLSSGNKIQGEKLAEILSGKKIKKVFVAYDEKYKEDKEKIYEAFKFKYEALGGKIIKARSFLPIPISSLAPLAKEIHFSKAGNLVLLSDGFTSALICKELEKIRSKIQVFSSMKSLSKDLIFYGGESVKRMEVLSEYFQEEKGNENFENFLKKYRQRFKSEPNIYSVYGYEAAQLLFEAIKHNREMDPDKIKKTIYKIKNFNGIQSNFSINSQGETLRPLNIFKMNKGNFEKIKIK